MVVSLGLTKHQREEPAYVIRYVYKMQSIANRDLYSKINKPLVPKIPLFSMHVTKIYPTFLYLIYVLKKS